MAKRSNHEEQIQIALFEHIRARGAKDIIPFHPPNGGLRHKALAAKLKRMGVLPGVPDVLVLWRGKLYALELKAPGNYPSSEQILLMQRMQSQGAIVACATGLDEALYHMERWGLLTGKASSVKLRNPQDRKPRAVPSIYDHDFWMAG